jgi:hypothetical protein
VTTPPETGRAAHSGDTGGRTAPRPGTIETVVPNPATISSINTPTALAIDASDRLFFAPETFDPAKRDLPGGLWTLAIADIGHAPLERVIPPTNCEGLGPSPDTTQRSISYVVPGLQPDWLLAIENRKCINSLAEDGSDSVPIGGLGGLINVDGVPPTEVTFAGLSGLATADDGSLYIADSGFATIRWIHDGLIETIAGTHNTSGDADDGGWARDALFARTTPTGGSLFFGFQITRSGNRLLVADTGNAVIRAIDLTTGRIERIAGQPDVEGYSGDGGPALDAVFYSPEVALACGPWIYIVDGLNHCVRRIDPDGLIDTVAGRCGHRGYAGDGGPADEALLDNPVSLACASNGDLYIGQESSIRRVIQPEAIRH